MDVTKEEIDLLYPQEEYLFLHYLSALIGAAVLLFCLFVFIFAPGRNIAKFGTVVDNTDYAIDLMKNDSYLLVLLDDGELVRVNKPNWFNLSPRKKVVLEETYPLFLGEKRYSFYSDQAYNF